MSIELELEAMLRRVVREELERMASRPGDAPTSGLSVRDAAARLGVGTTTVREMIASGSLRITRIGRRIVVPGSEVERVLAQGATTEPAAPDAAAVVALPSARAIEEARRAVRRGGGR